LLSKTIYNRLVISTLVDFIAKVDDGHDDLLNLIIEVSREKLPDKDTKMETIKNLWVPAVNNTGQFGRWASIYRLCQTGLDT